MNPHSIIYLDSSLNQTAEKWADKLSLKCFRGDTFSIDSKALQEFIRKQCLNEKDGLVFTLDEYGLALQALGSLGKQIKIRADFNDAATTYRRKKGGGKEQMIAKAIGLRNGVSLNVLDATAGLGRDAFVLASLGCRVTLLERSPFVHALLEDGLERARRFAGTEDPELLKILARMQLVGSDALNYMESIQLKNRPDVVYLDPMFPPRTKSALVKKEMQVLHQLLGAEQVSEGLLETALKITRHRVVVKRPRVAPALSGAAPSHIMEGKRNRFDVYALRRIR